MQDDAKLASSGQLTQEDASRPARSDGLSPNWKRKKQQAAAAGFKSPWEMRKASHQAKHRGYVPTASAEPATPLLDRLEAGNGPVRIIVKDGVRL